MDHFGIFHRFFKDDFSEFAPTKNSIEINISMRREDVIGNQGGLRSIRSLQIVFDMFDRFDIKKSPKFRNATFEGIKPIVPGFFESESDSKESLDDRFISPKSGKNEKCHF